MNNLEKFNDLVAQIETVSQSLTTLSQKVDSLDKKVEYSMKK